MKKATPRLEKRITLEQAVARLENACARAEHCSREVRDKLWQWGFGADDAEKIVAGLVERRFVDDERFARAFINDKVSFARWGRRKIRAGLAVKRIDSRVVSRLLEEIDEEAYDANLTAVLRLKAASIADPLTFDGRTRLFRHAISRGYEPDKVAAILRRDFVN